MSTQINWEIGPEDPVLSPETIHVWAISFEAERLRFRELLSLLSPDEKQRAARFHFEKDQIHFVTARGVLREILGGYLDMPAASIRFNYGKNGKPEAVSGSIVKFNLSHSGDLAVYAFSPNREVGIDVEQMRWLPEIDEVARRFFYNEEIKALGNFHGSAKLHEFYRIWTRGEAFLKWCGEGLVEPDHRKKLTSSFDGTLQEMHPSSGYAAAIAASGAEFEIQTWSRSRIAAHHVEQAISM